jgi:HD-GYP domain-containing protein (c-di-GMP phosphodiesterase class II)
MSPSLLRLDWRTHQSRVARRVFSLFVTCALLPVGVFACIAYRQVVDELEREALDRLHRESKNAGMSILERLLLLDDGIQKVLATLPDHSTAALAEGSRSLEVVTRGGATRLRVVEGELEGTFSEYQHSQLEAGASILVTTPRESAPAQLRLVRRHAVGADDRTLVADLAAEYVFAPEGRDLSDHYWVEDARGRRIFAADRTSWLAHPVSPFAPNAPRNAFGWEEGGENLLGAAWPLFLASRFASEDWIVAHGRARSEIHRPLEEFKATFPSVVGLSLLGVAWISLVQIRRRLVPITKLVAATRRLASRRFETVQVDTRDEFEELAEAFNEMSDEISRQLKVLATVNRIGTSLSGEHDEARLLELIVRGAISVTGADGGGLFLTRDDGRLEQAVLVLSDAVEQFLPEDAPGLATAQRCAAEGTLRQVLDGSGTEALASPEWRRLEERCGYRVGALLAVPLRKDRRETIGVLQLLRAVDAGNRPLPFPDDSRDLALSIASQAAVALTKTRLVDSFRSLFEGLIHLTVRAIDEKSAHTGEHCRKVPVLAELIAETACAATTGPLKDFDLTPEERYELRIAAQLHDCGKVVTPVHVMDKATKLETIFDRIELVKLRFAILERDARLKALSAELARRGADPQGVLASPELARALRVLSADWEFLRRCNVGGESMPEEHRGHVLDLADQYRWRDFDGAEQRLLSPIEAVNLGIAKGTLNDEEREIINYHAIATIRLLEELPFPKHMKNVPAIAGSHHERMDGEGYPNRLRRDQISMQGRILGLADVFEALTAKDRPYKPGRTLTESLDILEKMRDEGHIDPDLHELFVRERLYLRYAIDYLGPEQIDEAHQEEFERLTSGLET